MNKKIYIVALTVFLVSLTVNVSALSQFAFEVVGQGTFPIQNSTYMILIGMGLIGLAGVSRSKAKN